MAKPIALGITIRCAHKICLTQGRVVQLILWESSGINSTHGDQLKEDEKKSSARQFYEEGKKQNEIAEKLTLPQSTVSRNFKLRI